MLRDKNSQILQSCKFYINDVNCNFEIIVNATEYV